MAKPRRMDELMGLTNIGPAMGADLALLGIHAVGELARRIAPAVLATLG